MNLRTFLAMLARDMHVARRNIVALLVQTLFQPMLFVIVFGKIMTRGGLLPEEYQSLLLPGIVAISTMMAGIQAVAMQLIADFQHTREIEDRLLAPIQPGWVAIEKVVAGMLQALAAGLVVIPCAWLVMGSGVDLRIGHPLVLVAVAFLVALLAASLGLLLGCSVAPTQIGLMFTMVLAPLIFFGCIYYPWSSLSTMPVLQKAVLINPMVYASEGFRAALTPQLPHLSLVAVFVALTVADALLLRFGLGRFLGKAIG